MPRPKRTRVASTRTTTKAVSSVAAVLVPAPLSAAPLEKQTGDASSDIYDVSDREKEKAKQRRDSVHDAPATTRTRSISNHQANVLETARQRRDSAMDRLENMTSTSSNQISQSIEQSDDSIEFGRKVADTPPPKRAADVSGLDLDDDMYDDLDTTLNTAGPASAQRSADTSSISASLFKRRPRGASFLGREEGYIRPSSRAGPTTPSLSSTFNIGVFKRRAREPSILGTAQKPRPQRTEPEPESDSELEDEDEEDVAGAEGGFAPEAESTPLKRSTRRSEQIEVDRTPPVSTNANTRKRKSSEGHGRRSRSSPFEDNEPVEEEAVIPQTESDLSSPPSSPPIRGRSSRPVTPIMDDELLAPPLSSSPSAEDEEIWPPLQSLARGRARRPVSALRRTPVRNDSVSDMSSPPSLTYSPNYREPSPPAKKSKRRPASKQQETKQVTTADLAGLLPRRRRRNAGAEEDSDAEVDISGLGDDDDELSHLDVRARRHPARSTSRAGNSRNLVAVKAFTTTRGKSKQTPKSANRRATITYGRNSDKENQGEEEEEEGDEAGEGNDGLGEENSQDMLARVGEELKNATRKFQEVDKWQLDYEEMTQSSSPRDAR